MAILPRMFLSLLLLAGCGAPPSAAPRPSAVALCAERAAFAAGLADAAADLLDVAARDRPPRPERHGRRVAVRVDALMLGDVTSPGDDGTAIECSARWRARFTLTPRFPDQSIGGATRALHPATLTLSGDASDYRAYWDGKRVSRVYGALGLDQARLIAALYEG
ncbi:MAG: hypothetical protein A4S12_10985 [Proteobacteria bacterium SG_bin5]|nr:hypothetical protein [Sphingomonas sp.]OQW39942.1 MAG: hypothetical protein A4S12_10985 [Proteobacteria bacterium SG_bin5]